MKITEVFLFFLNYFIYFWLCWVLLRVGFLQLRRVGATLPCSARASYCGGFSCCGAQAVGAWASVVAARGLSSCGSRALERKVGSCGTRASLFRDMWDLPGPGIEPMSHALAGGFLTTAPPGKPKEVFQPECFDARVGEEWKVSWKNVIGRKTASPVCSDSFRIPLTLERWILLSSEHREGASHVRDLRPAPEEGQKIFPVPAVSQIPST